MNRPLQKRIQAGLTLVELMVSLVISMTIVIAASSFYLGSGRSRDSQEAASILQDNARFATEIITRNIQQAGYQNYIWSTQGAAGRREVMVPPDGEPDLRGYNNSAAGSSTDHGVHNRSTNRVNNSDTLVVRFQGSGVSPGDGSMIDCLGRPQPEPTVAGDRAYSVFEVRQSSATTEPELRCKYYNSATSTFSSEVVVRGVEKLQFMYGLDTNGDTYVDRWRNASEVDVTSNAISDWSVVRSVRVGMILRYPGRTTVGASGSGTTTLAPLGTNFSQGVNDNLVVDRGDGFLRRVVTFTVNLRNSL